MKSVIELPQGYGEQVRIDLAKDRKLFWRLQGLALIIALAAFGGGLLCVPLSALLEDGMKALLLRLMIACIGMIVYMVLHELVHGVFMRLFSKAKVRYGVGNGYAYAYSEAYYAKTHYIIIALAPIIVLGAALGALSALAPRGWFWVVWALQLVNLSGAAGDLYVTCRIGRMSRAILVRDDGAAMSVYAPEA